MTQAPGNVHEIAGELASQPQVTTSVLNAVAAQLATGAVAMVGIANQLGMSVATLRRRLHVEGKRYAEIVDGLRRERAEQYLKSSRKSTGEIARLVGFADARALEKAFRRWRNESPWTFRKRTRPVSGIFDLNGQ